MYGRLAVLAGALVLGCAAPLAAQDAVLNQMYGSGVHAYFSQEYQQAYDHLTSAIDAGSSDPRCYYFRGLCYLKLGREDEAKADFQQAARREAEDINRFYNVGRALERVQGKTRLMVEQYRAEARMEAMRRAAEIQRLRYGELREAEQKVLERQGAGAPATPPEVPAQEPPTVVDPLGLGTTPVSPVGPDDVPPPEPAQKPPAQPPAAPPEEAAPANVPPPAGANQNPFVPGTEEPAAPAAEQPPALAPESTEAVVPPDVGGRAVLGALTGALGKAIVSGLGADAGGEQLEQLTPEEFKKLSEEAKPGGNPFVEEAPKEN
jgi:hypothetical protein